MRVVWTHLAEAALDEALDFIAVERPSAALEWLDVLMRQVRTLERFPDAGRIVPELQRPDIREVLVGPYRVAYHRDDEQVTVLVILHDRRLFDLGDIRE